MRIAVNSVDFYHSFSTEIIPDKVNMCEVKIQACDDFDKSQNCEAIEVEIHALPSSEDLSFYATLNYDNALFLANSILNILEIQKSKL